MTPEDLSPKIKKLIKAYKKLFLIITYDENGKKIMSGPKAHKEASRQLGVDPDDMEEYLRLEYYDFFDTVNKEWEKQKGKRKERYSNEIWGKVDGQPQPRSPSTGWIVGEVDEDSTKIKEDLDTEIVSLALSMDDEFAQSEDTVNTISELLRISHTRVLAALIPDTVGG
jgi:hypothetical protein